MCRIKLRLLIAFLGFTLTSLTLVTDCHAEVIGASSVEWLTVSSGVVATGKILKVKTVKGEGSVVYENYVLQISETIKGVKEQKTLEFTIRTFSTQPVFGKTINISDEVMVFLSPNTEEEEFLKGKLVPTSDYYPLSVLNLKNPSKYVINLSFDVLKKRNEIIETCRQAQRKLFEYKKQNPQKVIKANYLEVPMGTEAFSSLYAGSSCFLRVPNFLSPNSKESILELLSIESQNLRVRK